jgi:uncharacterized protein (TIGR02118 family)
MSCAKLVTHMIRVTISYPNQAGSRFDVDYYLNTHMPMVEQKLRPHGLTAAAVDQGLSGGAPGSDAKYRIQTSLSFPTPEQMEAGFKAEGAAFMSDIKNFTDIRPEMQIYQVLK